MVNSELAEALDLLQFITDFEAAGYADGDDPDPERLKAINAAMIVLKNFPKPDHYVAWLRWNGTRYVTCDSDADGAFPVCRDPHF